MPKRLARVIDYKKVFGSVAGKRVLWDIMQEGHMLAPTPHPEDQHAMFINEGKRNLVLYILHILKVDVQKLKKQIDEEIENERRESAEF